MKLEQSNYFDYEGMKLISNFKFMDQQAFRYFVSLKSLKKKYNSFSEKFVKDRKIHITEP